MKKHLLFALLAAMFSFVGMTSCSDDNSVDPTPDVDPELEKQPFTVTALEDNTMVWFQLNDAYHTYTTMASLMYSTDGEEWQDYGFNNFVTLDKKGDKVYFKAGSSDEPNKRNKDLSKTGKGESQHISLASNGKISVSGNILSLLYGENPGNKFLDDGESIFAELFADCAHLVSAADLVLPTNTKTLCFEKTFANCNNLEVAPILRARTMSTNCYSHMFMLCESLKQAPQLPAKELAPSCYSNMFHYCSSLKQAPALPATTLAKLCYEGMFWGCINLTQAPVLPAKYMKEGCYQSMFYQCSKLLEAPELPSTTLAIECYEDMFCNCFNLQTAPELPATYIDQKSYKGMFWGCQNLPQAPALPATKLNYACYEDMFRGCVSLTEAPELPAKDLKEFCYDGMFKNCQDLIRMPLIAATSLTADGACQEMFQGCKELNEVTLKATSYDADAIDGFLLNAGNKSSILYVPSGMASDETLRAAVPSNWTITEM